MAVFLWIVAIVAVVLVVGFLIRFWKRTSAPRLITCPENDTPQAVELDPGHRLRQALQGKDAMYLRDCSRWPEREDCGQQCLAQIAAAPDGCRVRSLLDEFYAGKSCVLCGKEFGEKIDWYEHEPAFIDADRNIRSWKDIPPEKLPEVMATQYPVCWDCKVIETVRQKHPERVTDRPVH
jgi:hypothetical protein